MRRSPRRPPHIGLGSLFGLPEHPLLVHPPVVLITVTALIALIALVAVFVPRTRRQLAPVAAAPSVLGALGAILVAGSGEAFQEQLPGINRSPVHTHAELGEGLRVIAVLAAAACIGLSVSVRPDIVRVRAGSRLREVITGRTVRRGALGAVTVPPVPNTVWVVQTGHSGARAVWSDTGTGSTAPPAIAVVAHPAAAHPTVSTPRGAR